MVVLKTSKLSKLFGGKYAVKEADIMLEAGKIYGLLGPNGSGKSTLMKMVAGLFHPQNGKITVLDIPAGTETKKYVAFMSTEQFFYGYMTIRQVGGFYNDFFDFDMKKYERLAKGMELEMDMKVSSLSSGMAAKLKVAATMSRNASIYMLDEPLNGIDLIAREVIITSIIEQLNENNVILISSHLINVMENILDEIILIKNGSIVFRDAAENIRMKRQKSIVEIYKEVFSIA